MRSLRTPSLITALLAIFLLAGGVSMTAPANAQTPAPRAKKAAKTKRTQVTTPEEKREGFKPLFDGASLNGWEGDTKLWHAENGLLIGKTNGLPCNEYLATTKEYGDFILRVQIKLITPGSNSGVQFRSVREPNSRDVIGYQADFAIKHWAMLWYELEGDKTKRLGLMPEAKALKIIKPAEWNEIEVRAEGDKIAISHNGQKTLEYTEKDPKALRKGIIGLQVHSGAPMEVQFRNIRIKELTTEKK